MHIAPSPAIWHSEMNKDRTAREDLLTVTPARPDEPNTDGHVWYRGWELGYSFESAYWAGEGWIAYKGGCDLGAPEVRAATYQACLDAIDDEEEP